ncbi:NERD domain-containing protein (plasmid) [Ureibacillus chungkukjangi]|uniref:nuclease-related domain-containing protein n=1 Tax=Ureibacillus chungkukjangi TaxID=1202712 RepID=UPI000D3956AD|nr:nuclease-related domain-containing protein [Ureibacillus chungkukjangi]HCG4536101.1 NERD domain-containing protein [Salmonella enterica subsp. enterica serovar Typhi str. AG3]
MIRGVILLLFFIFALPIGIVYFLYGYQPEIFVLIGVFGVLISIGALSGMFEDYNQKKASKWAFPVSKTSKVNRLTNRINLTAKVKKILSIHIQSVKSSIEQTCDNTPLTPFSNFKFVGSEVKADNDELEKILESEFKLLTTFDKPQLYQNLEDHIKYIEGKYVNDISTIHIKQILIENGIQQYISEVKEQLLTYRKNLTYAVNSTKQSLSIISSGVKGEANVNNELSLYKDIWNIYSGVRFEVDGQSIETDNLIVCTKGLFSIEVKNYAPNGQYNIIVTKDGQWLKQLSNGGKIVPMEKDVTAQVNRHLALKQRLIHSELKKKHGEDVPYILFQPMIVIANDTVLIQNDTDLPIIRRTQIYHHIIKKPDVLTAEQVNDICSIIEENRLPVKKYSINTYSDNFPIVLQELVNSEQILRRIRENIEKPMEIASNEIYAIKE